MKKSPHRLKHEKAKAIREAQKQGYQQEEKVIKDKEKKIHITSSKKAKINRSKANPSHKHHKTSPDEVTWETEPDSPHREGARWIETVKKQTMSATSHLRRKLEKKGLFKKKK